MNRFLSFLFVLLLAACQPEPVDPAADETAGAEKLALYEAARADGDFEIAEMHGNLLDQDHGKTQAAATMRKTIDEVRAQAEAMRERRRLIGLWDYQSVAVEGGTQHSAAIYSKVPGYDAESGGPAPRPEARLVLRRHPQWGESAYLVLEMSTLRCGPPCRLAIRFDDQPAREFAGEPADTGTGPALFIKDEPGFLAAMSSAQRVRIELPRNGVLVPRFEFEVGGFRPALYRGD
ncbi:hypothetical protein [Arenimonas donghaensis]|uniref:Lipoprotein n=1 Tax=Arenimonas donghaensis DSM 18148 = HO3-R19 TaxID=1121014 RepID=A0A087MIT6_9GAMM|nr:hypothetical protein [Arenimonas donghaensis]KFL36789.1 hypothetical protein N788_04025 [Arenimonas donghaensis DSM 18148 = HO3-R19]